mmetsp:Transcript_30891/g.81880  ORF Transcript_30891/g.81880 Transcript_30891/m.81880 type:complete len:122 (+) Transcript_30891:3-368(+)
MGGGRVSARGFFGAAGGRKTDRPHSLLVMWLRGEHGATAARARKHAAPGTAPFGRKSSANGPQRRQRSGDAIAEWAAGMGWGTDLGRRMRRIRARDEGRGAAKGHDGCDGKVCGVMIMALR